VQVSALLLDRFDFDGSGELDTAEELAAISCDTWNAVEASLAAGGQYERLRQIYGFSIDYIWVGHAIGVSEMLRGPADDALAACGLTIP